METILIAGILTVCVPEPILELADISQWQYRTKVDGRPERCWYVGRRMKPRDELTWAEQPALPVPFLPDTPFEERWKGETR